MTARLTFTVRTTVLSAFLAGTLAVLWWVERTGESAQATVQSAGHAVDWYAYRVDYRKFGRHGRLNYRWSAPQVDHFDRRGVVGLRNPHVVVYNRDGSRWITDARFGTVTDDNSHAVLRGDVNIVNGDGSVAAYTQLLRGYPEWNYVETDRPVTVVGKADRTDAVGMRAWLDEERYELLSQVVTIHAPNR